MEPNSKEVTATPADTQDAITDRYEVETNIASEPVKDEPAKEVEPTKDSEPEPSEEPQESKTTINPRTAARKAEKERLIRENAELKAELAKGKQPPQPEGKQPRDLSKEPNIQDYDDAVEEIKRVAARQLVALAGIEEARAFGLAHRIYVQGVDGIAFSSQEKEEAVKAIDKWMTAEERKIR